MHDDDWVERPTSFWANVVRTVLTVLGCFVVVGILLGLSIIVDNPSILRHKPRPENPTDGTVAEGEVIIMPVPFHHRKK